MIGILILILLLAIYPVWWFIKLARFGGNMLLPDFDRMNKELFYWRGFYPRYEFFYCNHLGGIVVYRLLILYTFAPLLFLIWLIIEYVP
jgi:hypothetical protein